MSLSFAFVLVPKFTQAQRPQIQTGYLEPIPQCSEEEKTYYQNEIVRWQKVLDDVSNISGSGWQKVDQRTISRQTLDHLSEMNDKRIYRKTTTHASAGYSYTPSTVTEEIHVENARSTVYQELVERKNKLTNCNRWDDEAIIKDPDATSQERQEAQERIDSREAQMNEDYRGALSALQAEPDSVQSHKLDGSKCVYRWGINPMVCLLQGAAAVSTIILKLFGVVLWVASSIFDLSIYISIISFKSLVTAQGVDAAWKVMRDLANLSFIFILFYIAISVIFDISVGSNGKKLIVDVIIIALLVNFSGFLVRVVVDASNVVAYEFYSRMSYDPQANDGWVLNKINANIGTALVSKLSLAHHVVPIEGADDPQEVEITRLGHLQIIIGSLGGVLIILMASFVLLIASILFIIRTVTLLFVYILSPIGLTLKLIPAFKSVHQTWLDTLIKQSFFAPAFLIPLFAVFKILGTQGLSTLAQDTGIGAGLMKISILQLIVMALIVSCMFIAQKFGAYGLKFASNWSGKISNQMNKLPVGTTKLLARGAQGVGRKIQKTDSQFGGWLEETWVGQKTRTGINKVGQAVASSEVGRLTSETASKVGGAASWVAKTDAGKAVTSAVSSGAKGAYRDFRTEFKDQIEHPFLSTSDMVSNLSSKFGVENFNVLGPTKEERAKSKEDQKQKEIDKKLKEMNDRLKKALNQTSDFETIKEIINNIPKESLKKTINLKIFVDIPQAARALSVQQLELIADRDDKQLDDAKHKSTIRRHILEPDSQAAPEAKRYMQGIGSVFYED